MDFSRMFQTWINVLTKPGEAAFEQERHQPGANLTTALIWVVIAGVIASVFSAIGAVIQAVIGGAGSMAAFLEMLPPEAAEQFRPLLAQQAGLSVGTVGTAFCVTLILLPIFFLIGSGILFVIAKLFGGTGDFEEQTYLLAAVSAPMTIISSALGIIPIVGGCISFFLWIYQLVLTYFLMKVSHNLTSGRAIGVVLTPVVIFLLCFCLIAVVIGAGLGAAMSEGNF